MCQLLKYSGLNRELENPPIPIRTFADWDDARPGLLEIDLVAHCGETTTDEYLHTLSAVDIDTRPGQDLRLV